MREVMSLDQILECARKGQRFSGTSVKQIVQSFLNASVESLFGCAFETGELKEVRQEYLQGVQGHGYETVFADVVRGCFLRKRDFDAFTFGSVIETLTLPGMNWRIASKQLSDKKEDAIYLEEYKRVVHPFMELTVEEYLCKCAAEEFYEKWFARDVAAWEEKMHRAPSVGEILDLCAERMPTGKCRVILFRSDSQAGEPGEEPFGRSDKELELSLLGTWVWILMVEVPYLMLDER